MKTKILLWVVVLFIIATAAQAAWDTPKLWYTFNGDFNNSGSATGNGLSLVGTFGGFATGMNGQAVNLTESGDLQNTTPSGLATGDIDATICAWKYSYTAIGVEQDCMFTIGTDATKQMLIFCSGNGGLGNETIFWRVHSSATYYNNTAPYVKIWEHICGVYFKANDTVSTYINGTLVENRADTGALALNIGKIAVGGWLDAGAQRMDGLLDELRYYEEAINDTGIMNIFEFGLEQGNTTVNFTAVDDYNSTSISNFSINITWNNGTTQTETTSTGGVYLNLGLNNASLTANVSYYNATNYFNTSLSSQTITANTSNTVTARMFQAVVNMNATEKVSGNGISGGTFYVGSKSGTVFNLTAATHVINFTRSGYYDRNGSSFVITALTNTTQTVIGVYSSIANISVYQSNGTILSVYGINITSITYPSWTGETGTTTNGSYYFNGINGTYQATINSSLGNETFNFTITATRHNFSYYYFTINNCSPMGQVVLNFTVRNEDTEALINNSAFNAWFNITSSSFIGQRLFNITYSSGNYYLICIPNNTITNFTANAQIKYSNLATYAEKNYYLWDYTLYNSPTTNINLYLTNGTTQVKLQVRDYADDGITDVYIKVLSYDLGTNSYKTTEIVKTDSEGDAYAQLVLNTYWYAFILEKDGEIIQQTSPTKITSSPRTFRVITGADYFDSYDVIQGITHSLTYNNATTTFSLTYSDPTGGITQGCIRLTKRSINGDTILNTSCVTSTAATILMNISDGSVGSNTYIADAYAFISGESFSLNSTSVNFNTTYKKFGANGLFLSMLLIIVLVMVGIWHPAVAIIMMLLGVVITNVMGLFFLNWTYIITFIILGVITAYRTSKSD